MAFSSRVARLSVITTEASRSPDAAPAGDAKGTKTRLGWPARDRFVVTIARTIWGSPVPRPSTCTTRAGRRSQPRRSLRGNCTNTTSPRFVVIVRLHARRVPVVAPGLKFALQFAYFFGGALGALR